MWLACHVKFERGAQVAMSGPEKIVCEGLSIRTINDPKGPSEGQKLRLMNGVSGGKAWWWWRW